MSKPVPQRRSIGKTVARPLSLLWSGRLGLLDDQIDGIFLAAGLRPGDFRGSKSHRIRTAAADASDEAARQLVEEFLRALRADAVFPPETDGFAQRVENLRAALARVGAELDKSGRVQWAQTDAREDIHVEKFRRTNHGGPQIASGTTAPAPVAPSHPTSTRPTRSRPSPWPFATGALSLAIPIPITVIDTATETWAQIVGVALFGFTFGVVVGTYFVWHRRLMRVFGLLVAVAAYFAILIVLILGKQADVNVSIPPAPHITPQAPQSTPTPLPAAWPSDGAPLNLTLETKYIEKYGSPEVRGEVITVGAIVRQGYITAELTLAPAPSATPRSTGAAIRCVNDLNIGESLVLMNVSTGRWVEMRLLKMNDDKTVRVQMSKGRGARVDGPCGAW